MRIKKRIKVMERMYKTLPISRCKFILRKGDEINFKKIKDKIYMLVNDEKQCEMSEKQQHKILELNS